MRGRTCSSCSPQFFLFRSKNGKMRGDCAHAGPEGEVSLEKQEEMKLMSKLAAHGKLPAKPQSAFLQKRLHQRVSGQ